MNFDVSPNVEPYVRSGNSNKKYKKCNFFYTRGSILNIKLDNPVFANQTKVDLMLVSADGLCSRFT